ncbi:MAG: hypothetical protein KAQ67_03545, partial [Gammaproteobacteria bacterium]|nr:hypothetical protein [Gammaproteobacteria bacterium]
GSNLSITQDQCLTTVASNSRCGITITHSPSSSGTLTDSLQIQTDSGDMQVQITGLVFDEFAFNAIVGDPVPAFIWATGGDSNWQSSSSASEGSTSLATSGLMSNNESSWLVAYVSLSAEKTLSFDWKVSSEENYDGVEFLLDGKRLNTLHGEVNWVQNSVTIPAGEHVLHWRYSKDYIYSAGSDQAWLDNVQIGEVVVADTGGSVESTSGGGAIGLYGLFMLFLYAYMIRYRRFINKQ